MGGSSRELECLLSCSLQALKTFCVFEACCGVSSCVEFEPSERFSPRRLLRSVLVCSGCGGVWTSTFVMLQYGGNQ